MQVVTTSVSDQLEEFSLPSCSVQKLQSKIEEYMEREVPFFVPLVALENDKQLRRASKTFILQRYFEESYFKEIAERVVPGRLLNLLDESDFCISQARVRFAERSLGRIHYSLGIKGKLPWFERSERTEFSIRISRGEYEELSKEATAGFLEKERLEFPGSVLHPAGIAKCYLDIPKLAGFSNKRSKPPFEFGIAEIEVPTADHLAPVYRGDHTFEILHQGINLDECKRDIRKPLRFTRLAREGFDRDAKESLESLLETSLRLMKREQKLRKRA